MGGDRKSIMGTRTVERPQGGQSHQAWVGIDESVSNSMRIQAMNLGGQAEHNAGGGPESFVGGDLHGTAGGVTVDPTKSSGFWGGLRSLDAGIRTILGDDARDEVGVRADLGSVEVGAREVDQGSVQDRGVKMGVSYGAPGAAFRTYHEDLDNDGRPERGLGVSLPLGPMGVSADRVSETPFGDGALELADLGARFLGLPPLAHTVDDVVNAVAGAENAPSVVFDEFMTQGVGE